MKDILTAHPEMYYIFITTMNLRNFIDKGDIPMQYDAIFHGSKNDISLMNRLW